MNIWLELFRLLIPVGVAFLSFWLSRYLSEKERVRARRKERYLSFYIPFSKILMRMEKHAKFSSLPKENQSKIVDMIIDSLQYLGTSSRNSFLDFLYQYKEYGSIFYETDGTPISTNTSLDNAFKAFKDMVLSELKTLELGLVLENL